MTKPYILKAIFRGLVQKELIIDQKYAMWSIHYKGDTPNGFELVFTNNDLIWETSKIILSVIQNNHQKFLKEIEESSNINLLIENKIEKLEYNIREYWLKNYPRYRGNCPDKGVLCEHVISLKEKLLIEILQDIFDLFKTKALPEDEFNGLRISNPKYAKLHQTEALEEISKYNKGIIQLPTGTGKTLIEVWAIVLNIKKAQEWVKENYTNEDVPVFVVIVPKILLANQIFKEIVENNTKINAHYLQVHSGDPGDIEDVKYNKEFFTENINPVSTTKTKIILEEYKKAKEKKVPLIIVCVDKSAKNVNNANLPVYMLIGDEAHNLVNNQNFWIVTEFRAYRKYWFTATTRTTGSEKYYGMNNEEVWGRIIYSKTPLEMIVAGEMLRPWMAFTDMFLDHNNANTETGTQEEVDAIIAAFNFHNETLQKHLIKNNLTHLVSKLGGKILIPVPETSVLLDYANSTKLRNWINSDLGPGKRYVFQITSAEGAYINGIYYKSRSKWLNILRNLNDEDEALVFHINIISEGIDASNFTALLPMNIMELIKFLQNFGRITRIHPIDRARLEAGEIEINDIKNDKDDSNLPFTSQWIKPVAYIIIPEYGFIGKEISQNCVSIINRLQEFGFIASQHITIPNVVGDIKIDFVFDEDNERGHRPRNLLEGLIEYQYKLEKKEQINLENVIEKDLDSLTDVEFLNFLQFDD